MSDAWCSWPKEVTGSAPLHGALDCFGETHVWWPQAQPHCMVHSIVLVRPCVEATGLAPLHGALNCFGETHVWWPQAQPHCMVHSILLVRPCVVATGSASLHGALDFFGETRHRCEGCSPLKWMGCCMQAGVLAVDDPHALAQMCSPTSKGPMPVTVSDNSLCKCLTSCASS